MDVLQAFIEEYGYLAVLLGCLAEGETVLVLAGFAAHLGYLSLPTVVAVAAVAGFAGDQALYAIGRRWGDALFRRFPRLAVARPRAQAVLERHGAWAAFGVRFIVGMRIVGAVSIGAARFPPMRFAAANAAGALVWAAAGATAGYAFGSAFTLVLERARHYELAAFLVIAVIGGAVVALMRRGRQRRRNPGRPAVRRR